MSVSDLGAGKGPAGARVRRLDAVTGGTPLHANAGVIYFSDFGVRGGSWTITIAAGEVGSNLTNFPVYLNLADMPAGFWSAVDTDGGNIRVKQSGSVIPFDVVKIDTGTDTGTLFFLASTLNSGSDNVFTLDLTGTGLIPVGSANGRNACWAAYALVWLGTSASDVTDRTGGANGAIYGGSGSNSDFPIGLGAGCGVDFAPGSNNDIIYFNVRPNQTVFTFGASASIDIASIAANMTVVNFGNGGTGTSRVGMAARNFTSPDNWNQWDNNNSWIAGDTGVALVADDPIRLNVVYDNTTERKFYTDGVLRVTDTTITARSGDDFFTIAGSNGIGQEPFNGKIAFVYSRAEALSADFLAAEYSNLNAPSSFYAIT